jgi:hypothetical protein
MRPITLPEDLQQVTLIADIVVRTNRQLTLVGAGNTIIIGPWQLQVHAGGEASLKNVSLAQATGASAVVAQGNVTILGSRIVDCFADSNVVTLDGLESRGAGIYINGGAQLTAANLEMLRNTVGGVTARNCGGAIFCAGSALVVVQSRLENNSVVRAVGAVGATRA